MLDSFKYELKLLSVLDMLKNFRYEFRDVYCGIINVNMSEKSKKIVYNGDMFLVLNENIFEIVFDDKQFCFGGCYFGDIFSSFDDLRRCWLD